MAQSEAKTAPPALVWFRDDLRLSDHPALADAVKTGRPVVCLYVLDEWSSGIRAPGAAARWWLAGSLRSLDAALRGRGGGLILRRGAAADAVSRVARDCGAASVHWNRRYGAAAEVDAAVAARLGALGIDVRTHQAALLHEPPLAAKGGAPFKVFTPFWRALQATGEPRRPLPAPKQIHSAPGIASDDLGAWALEPSKPDWAADMRATWERGEAAGQKRLADFADGGIDGYADGRDRPDRPATSRLSPYLRFGEVSPFQAWHAVRLAAETRRSARAADTAKFLSELAWREFSYHLLAQRPDLHLRNIDSRFDGFPWRSDPAGLRAWQRGRTGYPVVDAGMRQLWRTGWMHNRVRMVAASFLIKHLMIDWREGERWFWDTLVDADEANNPASWQWVAGCGADAAPYFRIFNPVLQGEKFDPKGEYVRRFVPEIAALPDRFVHNPWLAAPLELSGAGISLGRDYPEPMVDHKTARDRALRAFKSLGSG